MVHMEYYLVVSTFMMFAGIYGFFTRRNLLAMLISVELILNSVDINFAVFNRYLFPEELEGFEQCWLTGTAAEVTPVGQIGDYTFEVGALTRTIADAYEKLVRS